MTEPVAYRVDGTIYNDIKDAEFAVREIEHLRSSLGVDNGLIRRPVSIEPLYKANQLHKRLKMTQTEFDEFKSLKALSTSVFTAINLITKTENYKHLKVSSGITNGFNDIDWQNDFVYLFINFTFSNPEETIEIVPDMKWFVQRNDTKDRYRFLSKDIVTSDNEFNYSSLKYSAKQFDTKEEAEKWTNPLTEAVQLPVEED